MTDRLIDIMAGKNVTRVVLPPHGFVEMTDVMPRLVWESRSSCDYAVVQAARTSTGHDLKSAVEDRSLLRYCMRHHHTSVFEQVEFKWVMTMPLFVARQFVRHRTACLAGDVPLHFDLPEGIRRRGNQKYTLTVQQVFERFLPSKNKIPTQQRNPYFKRGRVQGMQLRCLNEDNHSPSHTRIVDIWESGRKPVYTVTLDDGSVCRMSADHLCYTDSGWKKLKDVAELPTKSSRAWKCRAKFATVTPRSGSGVPQSIPKLDLSDEKWKSIPGWTGVYEASSQGRIRRCDASPYKRGDGVKRQTVSQGRLCVSLSQGGKCKMHHVQVLVLSAFAGPRPSKAHWCCHRNGNALDCRALNMYWGLPKQNGRDAVRHGSTATLSCVFSGVSSIVCDGAEMTYDLEVEGPYHNFVAGGMVVHNSINEQSGRYAVMPDKFFVPEDVRVQSETNRQGGDDLASPELTLAFREWINGQNEGTYGEYEEFVKKGVSRELARLGLPVTVYTRWYWKCDLHNTLHFLSLRADKHAQKEIRVYAEAMYDILRQFVPQSIEAWEDYRFNAMTLTRQEVEMLATVLAASNAAEAIAALPPVSENKRENAEWYDKLRRLGVSPSR